MTAPARYQVVANGLLQEERDLGDGRRLTHWKEAVPIASWLNALGVAQFAAHHAGLVNGIPLEAWVYHQDRDPVVFALEKPAPRVLEFYSEHIGPFPYEKLANVQAAGLSGGTEHASVIFYGERSVLGRDITGLVAHEIAHQWFGDSVTERDWDDIWLSEGFATYFTLLFTEHDEGRDAFVTGLKRSREAVFTIEKRNPELAVLHDNLSDTKRVLNGLVYQKGGWTLHMLRHRWVLIRSGPASGTTISAIATATPRPSTSGGSWKRLLGRNYLDSSLNGSSAGSPELQGHWAYNVKDKRIEIDLDQVQSSDPYRLPLEIGISSAGGAPMRIEKVELTERKRRLEIAADIRSGVGCSRPELLGFDEVELHTPIGVEMKQRRRRA